MNKYICSAQSGNLCNLQIELRKLKIQIGTLSADCAILIVQTVEPQVLLQQPQIPPLIYFYCRFQLLSQTKNKKMSIQQHKIKANIVMLEFLF